MRTDAPFQASDLEELDARLLSQALRVVPMRDISKGDDHPDVIGLRHDVDDNPGSFDTALEFARWEFEHGYSSTYFLLHGSHYWDERMFCQAGEFEELGHEVGIHVNAIAEGLRCKADPHEILADAIEALRLTGVRVVGSVAHGDNLCHQAGFVNDEVFSESPRPTYGAPDRWLRANGWKLRIQPMSRRAHGLEYDASWLKRGNYLSDSSGQWSQPFDDVVATFGDGQLHMLIHPDWWGEAFVREEVLA